MSSPPHDGSSPFDSPAPAGPSDAVSALVAERPEVAVGVAFVGGLVLARILRRLGR